MITNRDRRWGVILPDGSFRALPRLPLERNKPDQRPPFDVTRPDGIVLHIVEEPEADERD